MIGSFPSDPTNPQIQREIIGIVPRLTQNQWVAFYQDAQGDIVGFQTPSGIDPWVTPQILSSIWRVWIYDQNYRPAGPMAQFIWQHALNMFNIQIPFVELTREQLAAIHPGAVRDVDLVISDLRRYGFFN